MKNYLVALKPFLIIAILRFINSLVMPVYMNLTLRFQQPLDPEVLLTYHKASSQFISILTVPVLVWVGFRICRQMNAGVLLSATTGFSFYLFIIFYSGIIVLLTPVMVALIPALILWIPPNFTLSFPIGTMRSLFAQTILREILMWSAYGLIGGAIFSLRKIRQTKNQMTTETTANAEPSPETKYPSGRR